MKRSVHDRSVQYLQVKIDICTYRPAQSCPVCAEIIGALAGSRDAICKNCGFKDPCCD